jgi:hypothetical protein
VPRDRPALGNRSGRSYEDREVEGGGDYSTDCAGATSDWGPAELAIQQWLGILPERRLRHCSPRAIDPVPHGAPLTEAAIALLISIGDVIASKMDPQREAVPEADIPRVRQIILDDLRNAERTLAEAAARPGPGREPSTRDPDGDRCDNPAVSSLKCPKCGSQQVRRSRRRGVERLLSLARIYPFRCEHCCERFLTVRRWNRCKTA